MLLTAPQTVMPFCTQCGARLNADDRFCRECGVEVGAKAPAPSARPLTPVPVTPAFRSRPDALADVVSPHEEADASHAVLLGSVAAQNPLSFAAPIDESPTRRLLFIIGCFVIVAISGAAGYRWYSRPTPGDRPVAVDATDQSLESQGGGTHAQATRQTDRPGAASVADAARRPEAPHGAEASTSNVIADSTSETTDAANALGPPDGRIAVIAPGGSLAVAWTDGPFYNGHGADIRVDGPLAHRVPYIIFARSGPEDAWAQFDVNRKGFPNGTASHDFGHHGIARAQQIMIRNEGTSSLYLDAVTPLHRQPETHAEDESSGHRAVR